LLRILGKIKTPVGWEKKMGERGIKKVFFFVLNDNSENPSKFYSMLRRNQIILKKNIKKIILKVWSFTVSLNLVK